MYNETPDAPPVPHVYPTCDLCDATITESDQGRCVRCWKLGVTHDDIKPYAAH